MFGRTFRALINIFSLLLNRVMKINVLLTLFFKFRDYSLFCFERQQILELFVREFRRTFQAFCLICRIQMYSSILNLSIEL